jgi:sarcosine oxidase subunit alpha
MTGRSLRLGGIQRGPRIQLFFNGEPVEACEGETIAAALVAAGHRTLRRTSRRADPRGLFCAMGVCFDCLVEVDGRTGVRACMTRARDGMRVERR